MSESAEKIGAVAQASVPVRAWSSPSAMRVPASAADRAAWIAARVSFFLAWRRLCAESENAQAAASPRSSNTAKTENAARREFGGVDIKQDKRGGLLTTQKVGKSAVSRKSKMTKFGFFLNHGMYGKHGIIFLTQRNTEFFYRADRFSFAKISFSPPAGTGESDRQRLRFSQ